MCRTAGDPRVQMSQPEQRGASLGTGRLTEIELPAGSQAATTRCEAGLRFLIPPVFLPQARNADGEAGSLPARGINQVGKVDATTSCGGSIAAVWSFRCRFATLLLLA